MAIAIMQGRLVPPSDSRIQCFPRERWRDEFALAASAGLDAIEWIYDVYGADVNPIATDEGLAEIKDLSLVSNVRVRSLCADFFMDKPLLRASKPEIEDRIRTLTWLIGRCAQLGVGRVVLPFVDASRMASASEVADVVAVLENVLPVVVDSGVELHLETSLSPDDFAGMLTCLPHPMVKVNYDSGNSSSLGYSPVEEFAAYGSRVGSVHIKDRVHGGTTVPLETGDADFDALFRCLGEVAYTGDFVLQVARGVPGDEIAWAQKNREFVVERLAVGA